MRNVSTRGEDIILNQLKYYYVIDALYLDDIRRKISDLEVPQSGSDLKEKVFPYTSTPFARIKGETSFHVRSIRRRSSLTATSGEKIFSCDTGLVIVIEETIFFRLAAIFDYDAVVGSATEEIDLVYWDKITSDFNPEAVALILAPGVDSGFDFQGSGLYEIES